MTNDPKPTPDHDPTNDLPDVRAVGITYDATADRFHVDVGEYVGDFEALGMMVAAVFHQLNVCEYGDTDPDDDRL